MDKELFDDLIASCKEVIEHQKGNLQLKTTSLEISDEEIATRQLFYQKFEMLSDPCRQKVVQYVDELLGA